MRSSQYLLEVSIKEDIDKNDEQFPFILPVFKYFSSIKFHPNVTFIIGENGSGKSTLLEAIALAWGFNAEGGSKNFNFQTKATHSNLSSYLRLVKGTIFAKDGFFLRAESFYNVASEVDRIATDNFLDNYGGKSLHAQSHGESFMSLILDRFRGHGFYILDEPEAALSPTRQMALLSRIHELVNLNSQLIIATHSPIILSYPHATIFEIKDDHLKVSNYEETDLYLISKEYLNNYKSMLKILLE